jgi:hypothetical protein
MVWKIALGVFLGMVIFLMTTCTLLGMGAKVSLDAQRQAHADAMKKARIANQAARARITEQQERRRAYEAQVSQNVRDAAALKADERCISGQKFRRVENGWEQVGSCS